MYTLDRAAMVIRTSINLIRIYAIAISPFIPSTANTIFEALGLSESERTSSFASVVDFSIWQSYRSFDLPPPLFQKLSDEQIAEFKSSFGSE